MAVSAFSTGTQAAAINTEHVLADVNVAGVFTLHVNLATLAAGDYLELRVKTVLLTGDTTAKTRIYSFEDAAPAENQIFVSEPIGNDLADATAVRFTLKQIAGTGRSYKWKVLQY